MRIFHVALREEWEAARHRTYYERSTLGRSLAEVGFVHCSRADQWQGVRDVVYADVAEPLVLLTIDTDRLDAPVVVEPGDPTSTDPDVERFPHVYGAVPVAAVVDVTDLRSPGAPVPGSPAADPDRPDPDRPDPAGGRSFSSLLMAEIGVRVGLAVAVMLVSGVVGSVAEATLGQPAGLVGAVAALVVGTVLAVLAYRRWDRRTRR